MTVAKPFAKWAGGKTALLPEILPRLPAKIRTYYEPFVGAGAVFFALAAEKRFERAVIGDLNHELSGTYETIRTQNSSLIKALHALKKRHTSEWEGCYYDVRDSHPKSSVDRAARFIYLNRTCFNGLYRVNKKGLFNTPFGKHENPMICDEENLRAVALTLCQVELLNKDFESQLWAARKGDAVYMDPPYVPLSLTSNFASYTKGGFGEKDQVRLRDVAAKLVKRGVHVLLSNSDTPFTRKLYEDFKIETVEAPRRINSKGGKRGNVNELLISGRLR